MEVHLHDVFQSEVNGFCNQRVADGNLQKSWDVLFEKGDVVEAQIVSGVDTQPKQQTPATSADDDLPADLVGLTAVPMPVAARLLGQYVEGGEEFVKLRHKHT